MNPEDTAELIRKAGGNKAFARFLGIDDTPWHEQRICNWKQRGLPAAVHLLHYQKIRRLLRRSP
jgi:hypothetical protein